MFVAVFAHVVAICISIVQPGIGKYLLTLILLSKSVCCLANNFFFFFLDMYISCACAVWANLFSVAMTSPTVS